MEIQNPQVTKMPTVSGSISRCHGMHTRSRRRQRFKRGWSPYLAELLEIDSDEVNVTISFDRYGLDPGSRSYR